MNKKKTIRIVRFSMAIYLSIGILFTFLCCKKNTQQVVQTSTISIDTINIPIGETYLQNYTALKNKVINNLQYAYNIKLHTIDIFDLKKNKALHQIQLEKEGPNGIPNLSAFDINSDTIIIQNQSNYILVDHSGHVLKRLSKETINNKINDKNYLIESPNNITINNFETLNYNTSNNELIIPIGLTDPHNLKGKFCIASICIDSENITLLPIPFPDLLSDKYYGKLSKPQLINKDSLIIYNFANSSDIYLFNQKSEKIIKIDIKSDYTENISKDLDKDANAKKQLDYYFHSLFFHGIQYDKYRNQYYRLHRNKSDDPSAFNNRETYLTIINSLFNKVDEIKLPTNLYPIFDITPQGLLFQFMQGLHENQYSFMIFNTPQILPVEISDSIVPIIMDTIKPLSSYQPITSTKKKADIQNKIAMKDIRDYLTKKMIYPKTELENRVEGHVYVVFDTDSTGKVYSCKISDIATTTNNQALREEALRLGKLIKKTDPNMHIGIQLVFEVDKFTADH